MTIALGEAVAAYGALLSSFLAIHQVRIGRRTVEVLVHPAYGSERYPPSGFHARIAILNRGHAPVYVRAVSVEIWWDRPLIERLRSMVRYRQCRIPRQAIGHSLPVDAVYQPPLPAAVEPGREIVISLPGDDFRDFLAKEGQSRFCIQVQDELNHSFYSRWYDRF